MNILFRIRFKAMDLTIIERANKIFELHLLISNYLNKNDWLIGINKLIDLRDYSKLEFYKMRYILIFFTFLFSSCSHQSEIKQYENFSYLNQIENEDVCQITKSNHDSWIEWTQDDKSIVFISSKSGKNNLYRINLGNIELSKINKGVYIASYLIDTFKFNPTDQLTFETQRIVECPVIVPNENKVAYRTYTCSEALECLDFDLRIYDFQTKKSKIIIEEEIDIYDFIDKDRILFISNDEDSVIKELNIHTSKINLFKKFDFKITSLQIQSHLLLMSTSNGVYSYNLINKELSQIFKGQIVGTRMTLLANKLLVTLPGPASGIIDLETKKEQILFNTYDYEPVLSHNKQFVAVISESAMGILIKRIK